MLHKCSLMKLCTPKKKIVEIVKIYEEKESEILSTVAISRNGFLKPALLSKVVMVSSFSQLLARDKKV